MQCSFATLFFLQQSGYNSNTDQGSCMQVLCMLRMPTVILLLKSEIRDCATVVLHGEAGQHLGSHTCTNRGQFMHLEETRRSRHADVVAIEVSSKGCATHTPLVSTSSSL